jgi:hypothetical protein
MEPHFQRHHADLPAGTNWGRDLEFYWRLRTFFPSLALQRIPKTSERRYVILDYRVPYDTHSFKPPSIPPGKSAHSDNILGLARRKVFRFGYLHRNHPIYMKKAIFALARYIQRVTGGRPKSGLRVGLGA